MKRIFLLAFWAIFTTGLVSAQVDVKVGPLGLLFNNFNVGIEFAAKSNIGVEITPGIDWKALNLVSDDNFKGNIFKIGVNGRYYFNPNEKKLNGFYSGIYTRYGAGKYSYTDPDTQEKDEFNSTRFAGGFLVGGKIVSSNGRIVFDLGIGFGRAFIYKFDDPNGTDEVDLSGIPFVNFDMPINLKIGYRFGGSSN